MPTQKQQAQGKALEYACALAVQKQLQAKGAQVETVESNAWRTAAKRYDEIDKAARGEYDAAMTAALRVITPLEPALQVPAELKSGKYFLSIQTDAQGEAGDVRDVLVRHASGWETGFNPKHNVDTVKHPRLSKTIDFCKSWAGKSCDRDYFAQVAPVFTELEELARIKAHWDSLGLDEQSKAEKFYRPVLAAMIAQLTRLSFNDREVPAALIKYLLGRKDFYKLIAEMSHRTVIVQPVSITGALGKSFGNAKPARAIEPLPLPTRISDAKFKADSDNTVVVSMDRGWTFSMRLHNASSRVESSLKLDVRLLSAPPALLNLRERW